MRAWLGWVAWPMLAAALLMALGCVGRSDAGRLPIGYPLAVQGVERGQYDLVVFRPQHVDLRRRADGRIEVMALTGSTTAAERYAIINRAIRRARARGHSVAIERSP